MAASEYQIYYTDISAAKTMHARRNPQYNMHIFHSGWGWGGVGWGGGNNVHVNLNTHGLYGVHRATICISVIWGAVGVGWG